MRLVIVESPAKAKKLQHYADELYGAGAVKIVATVGHWRGLPPMDGKAFSDVVDTKTWVERFVVHDDDKAARLGSAIRAATDVVLATDADREGEAIAWHIADHFRLRGAKRATYKEVTKAALSAALAAPRPLDQPLVEAQRTRQVLDYLLGMEISRSLWRFGCKSAGRVQSAALRIVVDRELAIENFKPAPFWTVQARYAEGFTATVAESAPSTSTSTSADDAAQAADEAFADGAAPEVPLKEVRFTTQEEANIVVGLAKSARHVVESVVEKAVVRRPPPPFSTATLQAAAAKLLDWRPDKTAAVAQRIYEAGLVTYIRTDSVALSEEAIADVRALLQRRHPRLLPQAPQRHVDGADAQGAHEAIRPTSMENPEAAALTGDDKALYDLIWQRTLVSQAKSAELRQTTFVVAPEGQKFRLLARGTVVADAGFLELQKSEAAAAADDSRLPRLVQGQRLTVEKVDALAKKTKPPARFTTETLMAYLKRKGIGRPSSYANIFTTLFDRGYLKRAKKQLVPDELGFLCDRLTRTSFDALTQEQFTAVTEQALDAIAEGKQRREAFLASFYARFSTMHASAQTALRDYAARHPELDREAVIPGKDPCSKCGAGTVVRRGRFGSYAQCTVESCGHRHSLEELARIKEPCPDCGGAVIEQPYRKDGKKAVFFRCENGDWKSSFRPPKITKVPCPRDAAHGTLREVKLKTGQGDSFTRFSCPTCDYVSGTKETPPPCPRCGILMAFVSPKSGDPFWGCSQFKTTGCRGSAPYAPSSARPRAKASPS